MNICDSLHEILEYYGVPFCHSPPFHNGVLNEEFSLLENFEKHSFTRFCEDYSVLMLANI